MFCRVLNVPPVLNMPGLRIGQGCEYERVTKGAKKAWIIFKMPQCAGICLNNAEYASVCLNSKCVWSIS